MVGFKFMVLLPSSQQEEGFLLPPDSGVQGLESLAVVNVLPHVSSWGPGFHCLQMAWGACTSFSSLLLLHNSLPSCGALRAWVLPPALPVGEQMDTEGEADLPSVHLASCSGQAARAIPQGTGELGWKNGQAPGLACTDPSSHQGHCGWWLLSNSCKFRTGRWGVEASESA